MKILITILFALFTLPASAALVPLSDAELGEVNGKGLVKISTSEGWLNNQKFEFIKITNGLTMELNANVRRIRLGFDGVDACSPGTMPTSGPNSAANWNSSENKYGTGHGRCTADIDMEYLSLGSIDRKTGKINTVTMVDPYIELAFKKVGGEKQFVGLRSGMAYQQGLLAGLNTVLSGNVQVKAHPGGIAGTIDMGNKGTRITALHGQAILATRVLSGLTTSPTISLEGTRNFWLSVQSEAVPYPDYSGIRTKDDKHHSIAQKGFWINMADGGNIRDMKEAEGARNAPVLGGALGFLPIKGDFYNQFVNNCLNGRQTLRANTIHEQFAAIHPNCR